MVRGKSFNLYEIPNTAFVTVMEQAGIYMEYFSKLRQMIEVVAAPLSLSLKKNFFLNT